MNNSLANRQKDSYWQIWRGICIVAVVLLHCTGTGISFDSFDNIYYFIVICIINSPVALFFVLSGYFVKAESFSRDNVGTQLKKRTLKLLVPYFIWSLIYIVFNLLLHNEFSIKWIVECILTGTAATPFYYILVLFYFTLLTPLLIRFMHKRIFNILLFACCFICLAVFYIMKVNGYDVWHSARYTIVWLPFYYGGILIRNNNLRLERLKKFAITFCVLSLILEFCEAIIIWKYVSNSADMILSQIKFTSFVNSACIAMLMLSYHTPQMKHGFIEMILSRLGDDSYGIFYVHCIFITLFQIAYEKFNITNIIPLPLLRIGECILVLALSIIVIALIRLLFRKKSTFLFGV